MRPTRLKFTQTAVATMICPPGKSEQFFWDQDLPGFGVRALSSGKRAWVAQYRNRGGQTRRATLGDLRTVTLERARNAARDTLAAAQLGQDPQAEAKAARLAITVRVLLDEYLEARKSFMRERSYTEAERALLKHAKPLHALKAEDTTRRDVVDMLDKIARASGGTAANRVRAHLSSAWTWAIRAGRFEGNNPIAATPIPAAETSRDRVLTDAELSLIWRATAALTNYDRIVRLLMLTAARRDEVGGMASAELALSPDAGVWTLPAARSKNHRAHELPLTRLALQQLPPIDPEGPLVFSRSKSFSGWSQSKARLDQRISAILADDFSKAQGRPPKPGEAAMAPWRLHDLRRTFATWANEDGHEPHVVEAVLNHVSGTRSGVAGVYNRAAYREQKKSTLTAWAQHIHTLATTIGHHMTEVA